jgi:isocitrate lyase
MLRAPAKSGAGRYIARCMSSSSSHASLQDESAEFSKRCSEMAEFFAQPRFANTKRTYTPEDVVSKQGSLPVLPTTGSLMADKLFTLFEKAGKAKEPVHTMGAIDPVQMTQMAKNQQVVYVSGWAASSVLTTGNNEVGPDLG